MKKHFFANWKMNPRTVVEAENLLKMYHEGAGEIDGKKIGLIILPPFVFLPGLIEKNKSNKIEFGAQNCFWEKEGAFTGEISPYALKNAGANYVLLGHSERRRILGENNEVINKKVKAALKERLRVILCVGESSLSAEQADKGYLEIKEQLSAALAGVKKPDLKDIFVAYEPAWAISTVPGAQAESLDDVLSSILYLRKLLGEMYSRDVAQKAKIIYGGSVSSQNAAEYFSQDGIDGALVGGASLNGSEVIKMLKEIVK